MLPNIQQDFDNALFDALDGQWGNTAPGQDWILDPNSNVKNKYAIIREYRTVDSPQLMDLVQGRTQANLGAMIITTTRMVTSNISLTQEKIGTRLETIVYLCALNIRQSQIGGERIGYQMSRDLMQTVFDHPFEFGAYELPVRPSIAESDFTTTELDVMRALLVVEAARWS